MLLLPVARDLTTPLSKTYRGLTDVKKIGGKETLKVS
jgi:hypothetical protein